MDGVGIGPGDAADAVAKAKTPNLDRFRKEGFVTALRAHGRAVGMPTDDDMGNSEVGHNAIGAGRIFDQGAKLVAEAIASGAVFESDVWQRMVGQCTRDAAPLHFIGLLSDGNVHSHIDHLLALIARADSEGIREVYVHALLDGRDVPKTSALTYIDKLEAALSPINARPNRRYRVASGGGRMFITMDRYEADWPMVERGWKTHVLGEGRGFASAREAVETFRIEKPGVNDQDLPAFVVYADGKPVAPIRDGACVIAFNFRGDRMLELVSAFEDERLTKFARGPRPDVFFAGMTLYDGDTHRPRHYLVAPPQIRCTLSELLCDAGVTQLACSETQKFGHVTYFWNGNRSGTFDDALERYVEVPSRPPPFDAHPEMRAPEITEAVRRELASGKFRFARLNFANGDMVGHTGNFEATVHAVEAVDRALGDLAKDLHAMGGALIVTADHGNADDMAERDKKTGQPLLDHSGRLIPKTSHSLNPVPFYVVLSEADKA
ncbi:MAG TPA: 2,3-bisphosphoglycerate-independent phosphoglycerate mutase, partial [Myxococcota bacterium]|nr:2,3-bisphosphoglycerate-independent phosphoglycerate mutase [Myxococcota bacterium]